MLDKATDLPETFCAEQSSYVMNKTGKRFDQNRFLQFFRSYYFMEVKNCENAQFESQNLTLAR